MLNNNKRRDVKTRADQVLYLGKKYRQDKKTRLLCMHEWVEEAFTRGYVGSGSGVDWVKTHNETSNLVCVTVSEHERIHNTPGGREFGVELKKERGVGLPPGVEIEAGS